MNNWMLELVKVGVFFKALLGSYHIYAVEISEEI